MKKPNGYRAETFTSTKVLPAGGYVCVIKNVKEDQTPSGIEVLRVAIDIAEGEYKGYYQDRYNADKERSASPKWRGVLNVWVYDQDGVSASRSLNSLGGALDDIGVDMWRSDDELNIHAMIGKKIGIVFRREEFRFSDGSGKTGWTTRALYTKPASDITAGNYVVPEDKPLQHGSVEEAFTATNDDIPF